MVKNLPAVQSHRFDPWVGKIPWRREWQPTPVFLPGKSHEQRSLAGYSPRGLEVLDTAEGVTLSLFTFTDCLGAILRVTVEKNIIRKTKDAHPAPTSYTGPLVNLDREVTGIFGLQKQPMNKHLKLKSMRVSNPLLISDHSKTGVRIS